MSTKKITSEEFDAQFDSSSDEIDNYIDWSTARRPGLEEEARRVNVDFPSWVVRAVDQEAAHIGISRQALIKTWVYQMLQPILARCERENQDRQKPTAPPAQQ